MKLWQVTARGEGFKRDGADVCFELNCVVAAAGPDEALSTSIRIATVQFPELSQTEQPGFPRAVINAEEIQELSDSRSTEVDRVELHWFNE